MRYKEYIRSAYLHVIGNNMKQLPTILLLLTLVLNTGLVNPDSRKEFEGTITFKTIVESKTKNVSTELLQRIYGDKMTLSYKKGNYKMIYNGMDIKDIYYIKAKNCQYLLKNSIDTLFVTPCDTDKRQLVSSELKNTDEKILNRKCEVIVNDLGNTKNTYWFDRNLYVNPENFAQHKFSYSNVYYSKAQAIYLKYMYEGQSFNLTFIATAINDVPLDDKVFELPNLPHKNLE